MVLAGELGSDQSRPSSSDRCGSGSFERAGDAYLIALRDLRLGAQTAYFDLQQADEGVRIGQDSVKASLVSYRDARARFNAGVNTKLDVLEAETQLARDRNI